MVHTPNAPEAVELRTDDALPIADRTDGTLQPRATPLRQSVLEHRAGLVLYQKPEKLVEIFPSSAWLRGFPQL